MQLVRAALDQHVRRHAAGQSLIGVERARRHADRFDRFERGHVRGDVRQPQIVRDGAFDADRIRIARRAVRAEREPARRVHRDGMHVLGRRDARNGDEQILIIAADRHRQIFELRGGMSVRTSARSVCSTAMPALTVTVSVTWPDFEQAVDAQHVVFGHVHACRAEFLESRNVDAHLVGARRHARERGCADFIGCSASRPARFSIG